MRFEDVIQILRLIDASPYKEVHLEYGSFKIDIVRGNALVGAQSGTPNNPPQSEPAEEIRTSRTPANPQAAGDRLSSATDETFGSTGGNGLLAVTAPLLGVFYRAPAPGERPFVAPGTLVRDGDTLCIVEVMKVMNQVTSPCRGRVSEVCAEDAQVVQRGQVLFWLEVEGT